MTSSFLFVLLLCGLGIGANAGCNSDLVFCKSCPPGWTWYGGYCYVFDAIKRDWLDSERFCNSFDGNLASIETQSEYEFIRDLVYKTAGSNEAAWVGGYDAVKEGYWFWSDGIEFTFNGWGKNEPNNLGGNENCMMINLNGKDYVNDAKCNTNLGLVCAKDP